MCVDLSIERSGWGSALLNSPGSHLVQTARHEDIVLRHLFYEAGARIIAHRHPRAAIVYGVGGPCLELAQRRFVTRRLTYYPPDYEYSLRYVGPTHIVAIDFSPRRLSGEAPRSIPLPSPMYTSVWRALTGVLDPSAGLTFGDEIESLVSESVSFARKAPTATVLAIIYEIHRSWREVPRVGSLARQFQISPQHLCRLFKQQTGLTTGSYSSLLKLDYARGLLWGTTMSIAAIAAEAGFSDQSHFNRVLTRHNCMTPRRLRLLAPCVRSGSYALDPDLLRLVREFNPVKKRRR